MKKILPCPFCGGEAEVCTGGFGEKFVSCKDIKQCGGSLGSGVWFNTDEQAIEVWNKRPENKHENKHENNRHNWLQTENFP